MDSVFFYPVQVSSLRHRLGEHSVRLENIGPVSIIQKTLRVYGIILHRCEYVAEVSADGKIHASGFIQSFQFPGELGCSDYDKLGCQQPGAHPVATVSADYPRNHAGYDFPESIYNLAAPRGLVYGCHSQHRVNHSPHTGIVALFIEKRNKFSYTLPSAAV